jgi:3-dehydroquinate synthase
MQTIIKKIANKEVAFYFNQSLTNMEDLVKVSNVIYITDETVFAAHQQKFANKKYIVVPAGEAHKQQQTVDNIINKLVAFEADRNSFLVGVGGGVITDMVGYVASIYMRGVPFGFVPTTILAMVDAAIGGKNGVDVGVYKNMVGTITQPNFLWYDYSFLTTLPHAQWVNGFAEVIKHAAIKDGNLFTQLQQQTITFYKENLSALDQLIQQNVAIKTNVVIADPFEKNERRLLNFGHTFGHALENPYQLAHGHAISIGMVMAAKISEEINNFNSTDKERLLNLLAKYELTLQINYDKPTVFNILKKDKKRAAETINFIVLNAIGSATVTPIPLVQLNDLLEQVL